MNNLKYVLSFCLQLMTIPIDIGGFVLTPLSIFIGMTILSIAIWAIYKLFE